MAKSENKTKGTAASVDAFIDKQASEASRDDCRELIKLLQGITKEEPRMWGTSMVGFGSYHYVYDSGREGDMFRIGFSPRKTNLTIYGVAKGMEEEPELAAKLGKHTRGKGCVYVKRLGDIDTAVLKKLAVRSLAALKKQYG